ncbi:MAG TPA: hypothetical protein VI612_01715 [Candidatus Nanoarchaeia archaeon]|nr:hypothetical protein [Candidatus Nanoarchaeia archaeon]
MKRILTILVLLSLFVQSVSAISFFSLPSNRAVSVTSASPTNAAGPAFAVLAAQVTCNDVTTCCGAVPCTDASPGLTRADISPNPSESGANIIWGKQGGSSLGSGTQNFFLETLYVELFLGGTTSLIPQCDGCRVDEISVIGDSALWRDGIAFSLIDAGGNPGVGVYDYVNGEFTVFSTTDNAGAVTPGAFSADEDGTTGCAVYDFTASTTIMVICLELGTPAPLSDGEYAGFGTPNGIKVSRDGTNVAIVGETATQGIALQLTAATGAVVASRTLSDSAATAGGVNRFRSVDEDDTANIFVVVGSVFDATATDVVGIGAEYSASFGTGITDIFGVTVAGTDTTMYDIEQVSGNVWGMPFTRDLGAGSERAGYQFLLDAFSGQAPQGAFEATTESTAQFITSYNSDAGFCIGGDDGGDGAGQDATLACGDVSDGIIDISRDISVSAAQTTTLSISSDLQTVQDTGTWIHSLTNDGEGEIVQVAIGATTGDTKFAAEYNTGSATAATSANVFAVGEFDKVLFAYGMSSEVGSGSTVPTSATPEFSATTLLLAVLLAGGFIVFVVRRRRY